jgi:hypothetical protein
MFDTAGRVPLNQLLGLFLGLDLDDEVHVVPIVTCAMAEASLELVGEITTE